MSGAQQVTEVVAALIWNEEGRVLICQRPAHKARALLWEFPGGKVEKGESREDALMRECREELAVTLQVGKLYTEVTHAYPDLTVRLFLFHSRIVDGTPKRLEHADFAWVDPRKLQQYDFCPADFDIIARMTEGVTRPDF